MVQQVRVRFVSLTVYGVDHTPLLHLLPHPLERVNCLLEQVVVHHVLMKLNIVRPAALGVEVVRLLAPLQHEQDTQH